jgi:hypothetical protein
VSGPIGTFNAGRQIVPMIYAMAETDVRNAQYFGSIPTKRRAHDECVCDACGKPFLSERSFFR